MADNIAPIKVRFEVDTAGLKGVDTAIQGMGGRVKKSLGVFGVAAGTALGSGITRAVSSAASAAASLISSSISAASDLNENISKTGVIFGEQSKNVVSWAGTMADGFGISKTAALEAASNFAIFGKSAGLTGTGLTSFSTDLTSLAGDLASFNNTSTDEAITALSAALRGESEPIRKYGVLLDDASLRAEAFKQGLVKTTKEALTPQQRVLAAQALIFKQTSAAQGDAARTGDQYAGQIRQMKATSEDLKSELGTAFIPIVMDLINAFKDALPEIKDKLIPALQNLAGRFREDVLPAILKLAPFLITLIGFLADNADSVLGFASAGAILIPVIKSATTVMGLLNVVMNANPIGLIITAVGLLVAGIIYLATQTTFFQDAFKAMGDTLTAVGQAIGAVFAAVGQAISDWWNGLWSWLSGLGQSLFNAAKDIWGMFVNGALDALMALPSLVANILSSIPGLELLGGGLTNAIKNVKTTAANALGAGKSGNSTNTTVNNYNVTAKGLTVSQVAKESKRTSNRLAPARGGL